MVILAFHSEGRWVRSWSKFLNRVLERLRQDCLSPRQAWVTL